MFPFPESYNWNRSTGWHFKRTRGDLGRTFHNKPVDLSAYKLVLCRSYSVSWLNNYSESTSNQSGGGVGGGSSPVTAAELLKMRIKGSCHLQLITGFQHSSLFLCPSSESPPLPLPCSCVFILFKPTLMMTDWLFPCNASTGPAGNWKIGAMHRETILRQLRGQLWRAEG